MSTPRPRTARYFTDNRSAIQVGNALIAIGVFFYVWFLGSLRSSLRAAEGGLARLSNPVSGYSVIEAGGMDAAITLAKDCPVLTAGGSIEVAEAIDI